MQIDFMILKLTFNTKLLLHSLYFTDQDDEAKVINQNKENDDDEEYYENDSPLMKMWRPWMKRKLHFNPVNKI